MSDPTEHLIRALESRNPLHHNWACEHLASLGPAAVPHLIEALETGRWKARRGAILALERIGDPACLLAVRKCLDDTEPVVRGAAIRIVGRLQDRLSLDALHHELRMGMREFRPSIVESLGLIADPASAPVLCSLLDDLDFPPAHYPLLVWALGRTGAPSAIPAICQLATKPRHVSPSQLEDAMVEIGRGAVPALVAQLKLGDPTCAPAVRALYALGIIAFPELAASAESSHPGIRARSRAILAAQGRCDVAWIDDLMAGIEDGPSAVRTLAAQGLATLADRQHHPALRSALPVLKRALGVGRWPSGEELNALQRAVSRIENATHTIGQMPLPAVAETLEAQLPRPAGDPAIEGPLPVPAHPLDPEKP